MGEEKEKLNVGVGEEKRKIFNSGVHVGHIPQLQGFFYFGEGKARNPWLSLLMPKMNQKWGKD